MRVESVSDRPKLLADPIARASRRAQLNDPHIAPLAQFVRQLREQVPGGVIPDFDPWDGGTQAELLYLLEAPGPKAGLTGFISRNNPDETAKNFFELNVAAGIPRRRTATWNAVPWYIGSGTRIRPATSADLEAGLSSLFELLALMPRLRSVALVGRKAEAAAPRLHRHRSDLRLFRMPHPSPMYCNRAPHNRQNILEALQCIAKFLN